MTLGSRLKDLRISNGITQEELAKVLNERFNANINKGMVSKWESDKSEPRLEYARNLSEYYNVSLDYIIGLTDDPTPKAIDKINKLVKDAGINTIAAHHEGDEFTEEDKEDIEDFINYILSKKKK